MNSLKNKWPIVIAIIVLVATLSGAALYFYFFFYPKYKAKNFVSQVNNDYQVLKENLSRLEYFVLNWEEISKGDLDKKQEELKKIKDNFSNFNNKLNSFSLSGETEETLKTLKRFTEKGIIVSENLDTIAFYFRKVEESVASFNKLNTDSKTLEETQALVLNFKSISSDALGALEKVEAPKVLISLDKDFKDLLRQYIKSADDLTDAINKKDTKKIDAVGRESDQAVAAINTQLDNDMKLFKESSDLEQEIKTMKELQKTIDENLGKLKSKYGI